MKLSIAAITAAALAFAGSAIAGDYECWLSDEDAEDIVGAYASVLTNTTWKGRSPRETTNIYVSPDYVERSDSILSLINRSNPLGNAAQPATVGRDNWFQGVTAHPIGKVTTKDILVGGGGNRITWRWVFDSVGIGAYPVSGFNLFSIDSNLQISEVDIEFNSLAYGFDIFELASWCK